jgi:hypothetical protein
VSYSMLEEISEFWSGFGFEPWQWNGMKGVARSMTFRKGSFIGEVASYEARDRIVWQHTGEAHVEMLLRDTEPVRNVMTQRFLLIGEEEDVKPRLRAFRWGFCGFVEVFRYRFGGRGHKKFKDLVALSEAALAYARKKPFSA